MVLALQSSVKNSKVQKPKMKLLCSPLGTLENDFSTMLNPTPDSARLYSSGKFKFANVSGITGILSVLRLEYEEFRDLADLIVPTALGLMICRGLITSL